MKIIEFIKKDFMTVAAVVLALFSFVITPPDASLLSAIDWKTLAVLFMLLSVLDGFKHENLFNPVLKFAGRIKNLTAMCFFLVFSVFFSSMFVTNDVSLIIFIPLTVMILTNVNQESLILPMLTMENIAAIRGSLLTPFGSPQNLFLFSNNDITTASFLKMMLPLWLFSMVMISVFIVVINRKKLGLKILVSFNHENEKPTFRKFLYLFLFVIVVWTIVSRTALWPYVTIAVAVLLLIFDRSVFKRVDYALLLTFLCFFVFASSVTSNEKVAGFLQRCVEGNEYWISIVLSQFISNVPAAIVMHPFSSSLKPLIYGLDTAGLVFIIGSLASVINLRLYMRECNGKAKDFIIVFEKISLLFFVCCVVFQSFIMR